MPEKTLRRLYRITSILLTVLLISLGFGLIASCLHIYESGDAPFSPASIREQGRMLMPAFCLLLGILAFSVILTVTNPLPRPRLSRPMRWDCDTVENLRRKVGSLAVPPEKSVLIRKERHIQTAMNLALPLSALLLFAYPLIYCLQPGHFTVEHLGTDMLRAVWVILPAALLFLVSGVSLLLLIRSSERRETVLLKSLSAAATTGNAGDEPSDPVSSGVSHGRKAGRPGQSLWILRISLMIIAVLCILLGIRNGGMADVLGKAVRICTECIGLG